MYFEKKKRWSDRHDFSGTTVFAEMKYHFMSTVTLKSQLPFCLNIQFTIWTVWLWYFWWVSTFQRLSSITLIWWALLSQHQIYVFFFFYRKSEIEKFIYEHSMFSASKENFALTLQLSRQQIDAIIFGLATVNTAFANRADAVQWSQNSFFKLLRHLMLKQKYIVKMNILKFAFLIST